MTLLLVVTTLAILSHHPSLCFIFNHPLSFPFLVFFFLHRCSSHRKLTRTLPGIPCAPYDDLVPVISLAGGGSFLVLYSCHHSSSPCQPQFYSGTAATILSFSFLLLSYFFFCLALSLSSVRMIHAIDFDFMGI